MSTLSKVFVVLLAVFSIAFAMLVIQYTAQATNFGELAEKNRNWALQEQALREAGDSQHKVVVLHLNKMVADQQEQLGKGQLELERLKSQEGQLRNELLAEQQKVASLTAQTGQLSTLVDTLSQERGKLGQQLAGIRKEGSETSSENFRLVQENNELSLQKELDSRTIAQLKEQNFAVTERLNQLREQLGRYELGMKEPALVDAGQKAVPIEPVSKAPIYGKIKEVREDYATISVGSADGVEEGVDFVVYRGDQYLGKLSITKVLTNEAVGVLGRLRGTVQAGDDVADHLEQ